MVTKTACLYVVDSCVFETPVKSIVYENFTVLLT